MARQYPALKDAATYASFLRKWEYLFAYAGAGFAKGYITCHMLTLVRAVSPLPLRCDAPCCAPPLLVLSAHGHNAIPERRDPRVRLGSSLHRPVPRSHAL